MTKPTIGILGIGQMGAAAASCFSRAGCPTRVWARDPAKLAELPTTLARLAQFLDENVGPSHGAAAEVVTTTNLADLFDTTLILECVAEDILQKSKVLAQLTEAAQQGTILTSCTSGIPITKLGRQAGVGHRLVGAHFWNPPHLMPVVEVIAGEDTEPGLADKVCEILKGIGKLPVRCRDVPGFIGNRLLLALYREAVHMVEQKVCSPADLDLVARLTFGLRLPVVGPCENMDLVGANLVGQIQSYLLRDLSDAKDTQPLLRQMQQAGAGGMRDGKGFYDWSARSPDELIDQRDRQIVRQLQYLREIGRAE